MSDHEPLTVRPATPVDEMILAFLADGLRPVEMAVRVGLPVGEVQRRIARLTGGPEPEPPDDPLPIPAYDVPEAEEASGADGPHSSRMAVAVLGAVAGVFLAGIALYVATSGEREGAEPRAAAEVALPELVAPDPPVRINGVAFEPVRLGDDAALPSGLGLLVLAFCQDETCPSTLTWHVGGPDGLVEAVPVPLPHGLRPGAFPHVSRDGSDLIVSQRDDAGWAVMRSRDAGQSWTELGRVRAEPDIVYAGPEHVAVVVPVPNAAERALTILPGGQSSPFGPQPPALTPWRVDFQIRTEALPRPRGEFGSPNEDRSLVFAPVNRSAPGGGNLLALYSGAGHLIRGWSHSPAFGWGTLVGTTAYVMGVVDHTGGYVIHDEDEGPFPGEVRIVPMAFDTTSGTLHRLPLDLPAGRDIFVLTASPPPKWVTDALAAMSNLNVLLPANTIT